MTLTGFSFALPVRWQSDLAGALSVAKTSCGQMAGTTLGAAFPDFQGDAGVEFLKDNLRGDIVAFARDRFTERAKNGQRVSVRSPVGVPDNRGVGNVLAEKRGCVGRSTQVWLRAWCSDCPVGVVVRGFPPLCKTSRQSDS